MRKRRSQRNRLSASAGGGCDHGGGDLPQASGVGRRRWKKKFGGLGVPELRELRQLREENRKLKQVVADLSLDRHILSEAVKKKW